MFVDEYENLRREFLKQYIKRKHDVIRKISAAVVASPYKYRVRFLVSLFSESSIARIPVFERIRYDLYHCVYDMDFPTYLGHRLRIKKPHMSYSGELIVKDHAQIADDCMIDYSGGVILESRAYLSDRVTIYSHNHPVSKHRWIGYAPHHIKFAAVRICENSRVGAGSIILPDCTYIGKYAVVAAGSVVTRNVPDYAIVAGNPARVVGYKDVGDAEK